MKGYSGVMHCLVQVIYNPVHSYFCSDLFFMEEGTNSMLATHAGYLPYHQHTREVVKGLLRSRGFRHSFAQS